MNPNPSGTAKPSATGRLSRRRPGLTAGGFAALGLLLLAVALPAARAALPPGITAHDLYKKGYLDVSLYPGVKNDGSTPDTTTAGLQTAIYDAYAHNLMLYFPSGTFAINDTLKAYTAAKNTPLASHHLAMVGSTAGPTRPVIKAHASSTVFDDASRPQVLVEFKNFTTDDFSNPQDERPATGFYQMFRGIDIDCGGKWGAIGLSGRSQRGFPRLVAVGEGEEQVQPRSVLSSIHGRGESRRSCAGSPPPEACPSTTRPRRVRSAGVYSKGLGRNRTSAQWTFTAGVCGLRRVKHQLRLSPMPSAKTPRSRCTARAMRLARAYAPCSVHCIHPVRRWIFNLEHRDQ